MMVTRAGTVLIWSHLLMAVCLIEECIDAFLVINPTPTGNIHKNRFSQQNVLFVSKISTTSGVGTSPAPLGPLPLLNNTSSVVSTVAAAAAVVTKPPPTRARQPNPATKAKSARSEDKTTPQDLVSSNPVDDDENSSINSVLTINDFNFRTLLSGDKPVLVDACSKNCGPCRLIEPTINNIATKYSHACHIAKFDVQDRLSQQFKVELLLSGLMPQALPTLLLFHKGQLLTKWRGIIRYEQLEELLTEHIDDLSEVPTVDSDEIDD